MSIKSYDELLHEFHSASTAGGRKELCVELLHALKESEGQRDQWAKRAKSSRDGVRRELQNKHIAEMNELRRMLTKDRQELAQTKTRLKTMEHSAEQNSKAREELEHKLRSATEALKGEAATVLRLQEERDEMMRAAVGKMHAAPLVVEPQERQLWNMLFMHSMERIKFDNKDKSWSPEQMLSATVRASVTMADNLYAQVKKARRNGTHDNRGQGRGSGESASPRATTPDEARGEGPHAQAEEGEGGDASEVHGVPRDGRRHGREEVVRGERRAGVDPCARTDGEGHPCIKPHGHKSPCVWRGLATQTVGPEDFPGSDY